MECFFKLLKKGTILQLGGGGKLGFDHHFVFSNFFLKRWNFFLCRLIELIIFKINCPDFFFRKMDFFVLFVLLQYRTSDFDLLQIESFIKLRKMLSRKILLDVRLWNCSTQKGTLIPRIDYSYITVD